MDQISAQQNPSIRLTQTLIEAGLLGTCDIRDILQHTLPWCKSRTWSFLPVHYDTAPNIPWHTQTKDSSSRNPTRNTHMMLNSWFEVLPHASSSFRSNLINTPHKFKHVLTSEGDVLRTPGKWKSSFQLQNHFWPSLHQPTPMSRLSHAI